MVANNAAWTPSTSSAEVKGNTPAQPATKTSPAVPEKPFVGKPVGVQWDTSKAPPKKAEPVTEADAPADMTPAEKRIWKIKVNGKEKDFDASDENELKRLVEKAYGADEAFQRASKTEKDAESFYGMLKEAAGDPKKLAALLKHEKLGGADFKKLAEQFLWEQIELEKMTPEQREQRRVKEELDKYKRSEAEQKAREQAEQEKQVVQGIQQSFSTGIEAAHKAIGLRSEPWSIHRMAEYARDAIDGGKEPDFTSIASQVYNDYMEDVPHFLAGLTAEQLSDPRIEKVIKHLRKLDLDRLKSTTAEKFHAPARPRPAEKGTRSEPKLDGSDWRAKLIRERS